MSSDIKWTPAQSAAIKIKGNRVLVSAAAGSGKSTVLTERIITAITDKASPKDIQNMMIVTFTRASADDLKVKIAKALRQAVSVNPNDKRLSEQLIKLPSARINTIHGVCYSIVKSRFDTLGLPASVGIADETLTKSLKISVMNKLLDDCYNGLVDGIKDFEAFCDNFVQDKDEKLTDKLFSIYSKIKNEPQGFDLDYTDAFTLDPKKFLSSPFGKILVKSLLISLDYYEAAFNNALSYFTVEQAYMPLYDNFREALAYIDEIKRCIYTDNDAEKLCALLKNRPNATTARTKEKTDIGQHYRTERSNFTKEVKSFYEKSFIFFDDPDEKTLLHRTKLKEATSEAHYTLLTFLREFDKRFSEAKLKRSMIDFNDIEHLTLKLLYDENGNVSAVAKEISSTLNEIYVDEYQDLNPLQNKIFKALSVNCPIFMVGDIKQSIYGFRGADPKAFSEYKKSFPEYDPSSPLDENGYNDVTVFLSNNFRSDFSVTEFSNAVSDAMFSTPDNEALYSYRIPYSHGDRLVWSKNGIKEECAEVVILNCEPRKRDKDEEKLASYTLEANNVANEIAKLIKRGIQAKDIAILLRSAKTAAPIFEKALTARNIPINSEKGTKLFDMPEIQLALCLLNCCDNPYRDIFLAGALRSPIFGVTLDEMIQIRRENHDCASLYDALISYTSKNGFEKGKRFIDFITKMRAFSLNTTVDRLLWQIYCETSFFSVIYDGGSIDSQTARARRSNLIKLHDLAKSYSGSQVNGLYGFLERIKLLIDDKNAPTASMTEGNSVTLMTVHSSKGLEFEYCFLCGTSHSIESKDASEQIIYKHGVGTGAQLKLYGSDTAYASPYHTALKTDIKISGIDEEMRMLYVALTRARKQLCVSSQLADFEQARTDARLNALTPHYYTYVRKASYIHWILTALSTQTDLQPKFNIINKTELEIDCENELVLNEKTETKSKSSNIDQEKKEQIVTELEEKLSFEYAHSKAARLPSKLSVSRLYPKILDEDQYFGLSDFFPEDKIPNAEQRDNASLLKAPDFTLEKAVVTGAEKGTATHVFMQFCNFELLENNGVEAEIKRLTEKRFILKEHAEMIDRNAINAFLRSESFKLMKEAIEVNREYRFNIKLPASFFTADENLKQDLQGEYIFVQGVIDCYLRDKNGNVILLDYKTDAVPKDIRTNKEKEDEFFRSRHSNQLGYYKEALKILTGAEVSRTYIYSFALSREIEI